MYNFWMKVSPQMLDTIFSEFFLFIKSIPAGIFRWKFEENIPAETDSWNGHLDRRIRRHRPREDPRPDVAQRDRDALVAGIQGKLFHIWGRVARFFSTQYTKMGENVPNFH
jgi:hypothetical protein